MCGRRCTCVGTCPVLVTSGCARWGATESPASPEFPREGGVLQGHAGGASLGCGVGWSPLDQCQGDALTLQGGTPPRLHWDLCPNPFPSSSKQDPNAAGILPFKKGDGVGLNLSCGLCPPSLELGERARGSQALPQFQFPSNKVADPPAPCPNWRLLGATCNPPQAACCQRAGSGVLGGVS